MSGRGREERQCHGTAGRAVSKLVEAKTTHTPAIQPQCKSRRLLGRDSARAFWRGAFLASTAWLTVGALRTGSAGQSLLQSSHPQSTCGTHDEAQPAPTNKQQESTAGSHRRMPVSYACLRREETICGMTTHACCWYRASEDGFVVGTRVRTYALEYHRHRKGNNQPLCAHSLQQLRASIFWTTQSNGTDSALDEPHQDVVDGNV